MTIAVALAVPDGIAIAADTQTTWQQTVTKAKEKATGQEFELADPIVVPIGWSRMARKLFPIRMANRTYAVAVSGAALLNDRTPFAMFKSLESSYAGADNPDSVNTHLVDGVKVELVKQLGVAALADSSEIVSFNFILAGYEGGDVAKPFLQTTLVYSGKPQWAASAGFPGHFASWRNSPPNRFGCCWTGRGEFVAHVVNHSNPALPPFYGHYAGMTLADARDYTRFLAEFTCDFQRFAVMVPDCGRPVLGATLTPEGYEDLGYGAA